MKSLLCFLLLFFFHTIAISGQELESRKVHLLDGSVLVGQVIEDNDYFIRIVIFSGDTLKIGYKYINTSASAQRITNDLPNSDNPYRWTNRRKTFLASGLMYGGNLRLGFSNDNSPEIQGFLGKRWSSRWNAGFGFSYTHRCFQVGDFFENIGFVTPSFFARYYLSSSEKPRWFVSTDLGYAISTNKDYEWEFYQESSEGGVYGRLGVGIHFPSKREMRWLLDFGLSYQQSSGSMGFESDPFGSGNTPVRIAYNKTHLVPHIGVGIEF